MNYLEETTKFLISYRSDEVLEKTLEAARKQASQTAIEQNFVTEMVPSIRKIKQISYEAANEPFRDTKKESFKKKFYLALVLFFPMMLTLLMKHLGE